MSTSVLVLRTFSGLQPGQVLDASEWKHTLSLEEDRYVKTLDKSDAADATECPCGIGPVLLAANLHDCEHTDAAKAKVKEERAARVAAAKAEAEKAQAPTPTTPTTPPAATTPPAQAKASTAGRSGS